MKHTAMRLRGMWPTAALWLSTILMVTGCSTVPLTGRKQLDLVSSDQVMSMSADQYRQFMSQHEIVTATAAARDVEQVGRRIAGAVGRYLQGRGEGRLVEGYRWEFHLVREDSANAWAMPGGKVAVYTGILDVARNPNGLATVMGHEVAHAVARHGNERMSHALLTQMGGVVLETALSHQPARTAELFMAAYGAGSQLGILLPYSRLQESEADRLGLIFMAMAGYDPRGAVAFWDRMAAEQQGGRPPEFLSTHPGHDTRIDQIRRHMPEALRFYRP